MIGHRQIVSARKQGFKPAAVFIQEGTPLPARFPFEDPEKALACNLFPTVWLTPAEMQERQDLRFLAGCNVSILGDKLDGLVGVAEQAVSAGAARVFAFADRELLMYRDGEWSACKS